MSLGTGFLAFIAGLQGLDRSLIEAGYVDGIKNRWQGALVYRAAGHEAHAAVRAVMAITQSFGVADVTMNLAGFPSTDYAAVLS
jgi:multiple sugar transport system permease protein